MTEIEIISEQISNNGILGMLFFFPIILGSVMMILSLMMERNQNFYLMLGILIVIVSLVIMFGVIIPYSNELQDERDLLIEQRDEDRKNLVMSMSCDILRLNTLSLLEVDQEKHIEDTVQWQQDYYELKCETPLLKEVMKLQ